MAQLAQRLVAARTARSFGGDERPIGGATFSGIDWRSIGCVTFDGAYRRPTDLDEAGRILLDLRERVAWNFLLVGEDGGGWRHRVLRPNHMRLKVVETLNQGRRRHEWHKRQDKVGWSGSTKLGAQIREGMGLMAVVLGGGGRWR